MTEEELDRRLNQVQGFNVRTAWVDPDVFVAAVKSDKYEVYYSSVVNVYIPPAGEWSKIFVIYKELTSDPRTTG